MEPNANNDQNSGAAGAGSSTVPNDGTQNVTPGQDNNSGNPAGQDGNQPNSGADPEKEQLRKDNIALNRALIEAKRNGNRQIPQPNGNGQDNPFDSESGRYAVALELADSRLRGGLEERVSLYPELPNDLIQRIRINPWAFASRQSFMSGDYESALDEIEMMMLEKANEVASQKPSTQGNPANPQGDGQGTPATVNNNPSPEPPVNDAVPGSDEDTNPWTMPLDKLEKQAFKDMAAKSNR